MADVLRPLGYALAEAPEQADLVVLNTCHIREQASEKVYSELGRLRDLKIERRAEGTRPHHRRGRLRRPGRGRGDPAPPARGRHRRRPAGLSPPARAAGPVARKSAAARDRAAPPGAGVLDTDFPAESKFDHLPAPQRRSRAGSAFLSIQEGCDKFCTFCVVPYTRGAEYSRPVAAVLAEARQLVAAGALELTLLGQNVNAYHGEGRTGRPGSWRA